MRALSEPGSIADALLSPEVTPDMPEGPWPSDIELEFRQRLADIEKHQLRSDRLVTEVQLEVRRVAREQAKVDLRIESKLEALVLLVRSLAGNGHGGP